MPHPTQIVSALADPARLALYARVVHAGSDGVPAEEARAGGSRERKRLARLADAGLVREDGDRVVADPAVFATALEEHRPIDRDPVDSLFHGGRLTALPARRELRRGVFERVTGRFFAPGVKYTEKQVNAALLSCCDDPSSMHRHLVDEGYLTRNDEGSVYRVPGA
ncbi:MULTISPECIES: DUF2087 domain-containing protein [Nocardiopsis]|uniref:DUF2087 domain-containing protein n=1 Tax=Nocardiopsis sinuspersici TaxID=501010 RepID=A0A1V3C4R6_9ACTN|nr:MULTISPECIES: DUF2087 domain-containing protein [Nocardiopsis]OOC55632.1 hypothetical protein NOSIN_18865 [Nocardiopsis sinuspersici]